MNLQNISAYELIEEREISDVNSMGYILKHKKSGARLALLSNTDDNKVFYIGFRTTPEDETGVPHIIEHTTLCGSDKYPVKDPFIELAKGSLNTFLNAMTYPDKTVYPIGSCNDADFKNLMDVYLDAVFHPNITKYEEIFKQEGWHYELESVDDELTINGVVYNEMKGSYSSAEEVLQNQIFRSLFPDNTYSKDSGGNPVYIPTLTYEEYLAFYNKYYHPSNSYIYLYGDMDMEERLDYLDKEYLSKYDYLEVDSQIKKQEAFEKIVDVTSDYSIASDDTEDNKTYLSFNRVVGTSLDPMLYQAFDVLDYALVSSPGAPIRTALIQAGIGEDVYGSYEGGVCQPVFSIVAKNANESDKERFLEIIDSKLKELIKQGINKDSLLAGINSLEFRFREADFGQFPKGLLYGLSCLDSWIFDDDKPFLHLECLNTFAKLKELLNTDYFEKLIEEYLLLNKHGSTVVVKPCAGKNSREEKKLADSLKKYKESLSEEEIEKLIKDTVELKNYQEEPSPAEELDKLPMLKRTDLKKEALPFSNIEHKVKGVKIIHHDIESNGIDYLTFMFDAFDVKNEDISYLGLLSAVLGFVDTKNYKYADLSNAINIYTGGISCGTSIHPNLADQEEIIVKFEFRLRVLEDNLAKALEMTDEIISESNLSDVERIIEIVAQTKARLQAALSSSGHTVASMRSMANFSKYAMYQDKLHGIDYYRFICEIEKLLSENPAIVTSKLKELCDMLFTNDRMLISFTGNKEAYRKADVLLEKFVDKYEKDSIIFERSGLLFSKENQAFTDSSSICYVARTGNFADKGFEYKGTLRLLKVILSYDYLWTNVRVKGGAYGCMTAFLRSGESYFVSYRDPNLRKTNEVYEGVTDYIRNFTADEKEMTKYIIGTFSNLDAPLNPEAKGSRSMAAYLQGLEYEQVQTEREQILNATDEDIRELADMIQAVLSDDNICVIGNENIINQEKELFDSVNKLFG